LKAKGLPEFSIDCFQDAHDRGIFTPLFVKLFFRKYFPLSAGFYTVCKTLLIKNGGNTAKGGKLAYKNKLAAHGYNGKVANKSAQYGEDATKHVGRRNRCTHRRIEQAGNKADARRQQFS